MGTKAWSAGGSYVKSAYLCAMQELDYELVVVGGGAAGFFGAITYAESHPGARVIILEAGSKLLAKVEISGGGRCNVTHACFEPRELVSYYPRGHKELLGPFHRFMTGDMMAWLEERGVPLKIEDDGRIFPVTDSSRSIIDCFLSSCEKSGVVVQRHSRVEQLTEGDGCLQIHTGGRCYRAGRVLWATGSSPAAWRLLGRLGHHIVPPVPSLFTFHIAMRGLNVLAGVSVPQATVQPEGMPHAATGPLLITHWGLSGPAVLKLSAWAARELHALDYRFRLRVNWTGESPGQIRERIDRYRAEEGAHTVRNSRWPDIPRRLWVLLCQMAGIADQRWAELSKAQIAALAEAIGAGAFQVKGKSSFKEEFVTCGGIDTTEVNMRSMESRIVPGLHFAGEVLNIDAVTGGFNFQAAWTTAWIAAHSMP